jgi:hypothetical protein
LKIQKFETIAEKYPMAASLSMPHYPKCGMFYTGWWPLRLCPADGVYWTLTQAAAGFKMARPMSDTLGVSICELRLRLAA